MNYSSALSLSLSLSLLPYLSLCTCAERLCVQHIAGDVWQREAVAVKQ
jgi:hypothetical protein